MIRTKTKLVGLLAVGALVVVSVGTAVPVEPSQAPTAASTAAQAEPVSEPQLVLADGDVELQALVTELGGVSEDTKFDSCDVDCLFNSCTETCHVKGWDAVCQCDEFGLYAVCACVPPIGGEE